MINEALQKVISHEDLTQEEAYTAMDTIMEGGATPSQVGGFLVALRMKGETIPEITGCAMSMREKAKRVELTDYAIDTCGTGGDGGKTFNISTLAALICASAGVKVAKHGNRAVSSMSGSADVLTELGVNISLAPDKAKRCIEQIGIGFLYAPYYHTSMKNVAATRKELGTRTIFNILGPLTNPAYVKGQVLGVYDGKLTHPIAEVLDNMGTERAMVVHGLDGLDEITTTAPTMVSEIKDGKITDYEINPEMYGLNKSHTEDIKGYDAAYNAKLVKRLLEGETGPKRDIVLINAAAALYIGGAAQDMHEGIDMARKYVDDGSAYDKLNELIKVSNED